MRSGRQESKGTEDPGGAGTGAALAAERGSWAGARRHWKELREHRSELAAKALRERPGAACREGKRGLEQLPRSMQAWL